MRRKLILLDMGYYQKVERVALNALGCGSSQTSALRAMRSTFQCIFSSQRGRRSTVWLGRQGNSSTGSEGSSCRTVCSGRAIDDLLPSDDDGAGVVGDRPAASRSLSFLLLRFPLMPPVDGGGGGSASSSGSKPVICSRGRASLWRFSIRRK